MPRPYEPSLHYWLAADGRVFSGRTTSIVNDQNPAYIAWRAQGNAPSPWPLDETGQQTDAALQAVLAPYLMSTTLEKTLALYAASVRWKREVGGIVVSGIPIATDDRSKQMLMGARIAATADPAFTTVWDAADDSSHLLDATAIIAISNAVLEHVRTCFNVYATIKADIASGVITTRNQIDVVYNAAFAGG